MHAATKGVGRRRYCSRFSNRGFTNFMGSRAANPRSVLKIVKTSSVFEMSWSCALGLAMMLAMLYVYAFL